MIGIVVALLLLTAIAGAGAGALARRRGPDCVAIAAAEVPVLLVVAAALVALAAPAAQGAGLAAVRVAAVIAAMAGGSALVKAVFVLAGASGRDDPSSGTAQSTDPDASDADQGAHSGSEDAAVGEAGDLPDDATPASPLRGGLAIGVLERAAIVVCVLANFGAGLAVIVAAKGLARYPELRHPGAAEQFIIGTFVSVLWACGCAGVAVAVGR
ncbi:hypothetical protein GCM10027289_03770 [Tsukamurella serpentis]